MRRGNIAFLKSRIIKKEKEKKGKGKEKRRGETRKLWKLLIERNYSGPFSYPIGKNSGLENLDRSLGLEKRERRRRNGRKGKSFFLPPGREIICRLISVSGGEIARIAAAFDTIDRNRGKIMEKRRETKFRRRLLSNCARNLSAKTLIAPILPLDRVVAEENGEGKRGTLYISLAFSTLFFLK